MTLLLHIFLVGSAILIPAYMVAEAINERWFRR